MLIVSLIIVILNLFVDNSHILSNIILSPDLFALFIYLFVNNKLLTIYVTVLTV